MALVRLDFLTKIDKIHAQGGNFILISASNTVQYYITGDGSCLPASKPNPLSDIFGIEVIANGKQEGQLLDLATVTTFDILSSPLYALFPTDQTPNRGADPTHRLWANVGDIYTALIRSSYPVFPETFPPPPDIFHAPSDFQFWVSQALAQNEVSTNSAWKYAVTDSSSIIIGFRTYAHNITKSQQGTIIVNSYWLYQNPSKKGQTVVSFIYKPPPIATNMLNQTVALLPGYQSGTFAAGNQPSYNIRVGTFLSKPGHSGVTPNGPELHFGSMSSLTNQFLTQKVAFLIDNTTNRVTIATPPFWEFGNNTG